ncbi:ABC transporter ATP-binding protein [Lachnoclostridium sp. An169]|uniref:ABC transporter ATP-binding protein n=1 Tax=Lachnoclostridium sp. An169 TaxID=1965569 RepID=UPI000B39FDD9|nr:ABC transporter ATP-binding protein [Lachnoclostridium sp. An169]OUP82859.1 ABC transporter ATP-binding protein [Lachnoclostridium sp. An169]
MIIAETRNLKKTYRTGSTSVYALRGVDLSIEEGTFAAIVGASGSGKSTLLNLLGALDTPTEGEVQIRGCSLAELNQEERTIFRRRNIGFVFQNYNLIPVLSVYENIVLPLKLDGRKTDREFTDQMIESLGLKEKRYQMPNTLSGGQQQRVAVARALITRPAIVLADEPTGNLDSHTGMEVIALMKGMAEKYFQTLAVVTHNEEIAQIADRIIRIEDGRICGNGEECA